MEQEPTDSTTFAELPELSGTTNKYEILCVGRQATPEELKLAYRRLALLYHPDRHTEATKEVAEKAFKQISAAYRTLSDEHERKRYDRVLDSGGEFREGVTDGSVVSLADILAEIDAYEYVFSDAALEELDATLKEVVVKSLSDELGEHIVGVWPMPVAPAGAAHQGTYKTGAVVLTNIRLLLPFTYTWQETHGNTKYRLTGADGRAFVLPQVERFAIVSERRLRNTLWVDIYYAGGITRFRPGRRNLTKLLLMARLWGIPVETRQEDAPLEELRWALFSPWTWAIGLTAATMVGAAALGIFWGGFLDNPVDLTLFVVRNGVWQWAVVACGAISARRLWRWIIAFGQSEISASLVSAPVAGAQAEIEAAIP